MFAYLRKLIESNSGASSKSFFLVMVTILSCILLIMPAFVLAVEVICNHTIATSLTGLASYIGSVSAVLASAGVTKVMGDRFEKHRHNDFNENGE